VRLPALIETPSPSRPRRCSAGMREVPQSSGNSFFQEARARNFRPSVSLDGRDAPVTVVADEFQELLGPRSLAISSESSRWRGLSAVSFWLLFQQAAQLEAVSPTLLRLLRTNTNYQASISIEYRGCTTFFARFAGDRPRVHETAGFPDPRQAERFLHSRHERVSWWSSCRVCLTACLVLQRRAAYPPCCPGAPFRCSGNAAAALSASARAA